VKCGALVELANNRGVGGVSYLLDGVFLNSSLDKGIFIIILNYK